MKYKFILFLFLMLDATLLFFEASTLSISYEESLALENSDYFIYTITNYLLNIFGKNDIILHLFMILLHLGSVILLYFISKEYLKYEKDRLWLVLIFILLPGTLSSALIVNSAGVIIFGSFLFVYLYKRVSKSYIFALLDGYLFFDPNFVYLFLALTFYFFYKKDNYLFSYSFSLFIASVLLYGLNIRGIPSGHFLDTLAIYSAIFTPPIFLFIFYTLYRRYLFKELDILWFISAVSLIYAIVLSFRQSLGIENIAPYLMLALPLSAKTFVNIYRIRLKQHRVIYKNLFFLSFLFLLFNSFILLFNKELYLILDNPKKNFIYNFDIAKELASELKSRDINCITADKKLLKRLNFYGIKSCKDNILKEVPIKESNSTINYVTLSYKNRPIYKATVTKLNK